MSQLIQGLLEYSQLGKSRELQSVDTEQLIQEVLKDLSSTIAEHRALIHIEAPMPVVQGSTFYFTLRKTSLPAQ